MREIKYEVIVSSNLNKYLPLIASIMKNKKTIQHFVNNNGIWHIEIENDVHIICASPEKIKNINIMISNLWLDTDISMEINKEIMKKYIGKKEKIIWI